MIHFRLILPAGESLGTAVKEIKKAEREIGLPLSIHSSFQGTAAAFQNFSGERADADLGGGGHGLHCVWVFCMKAIFTRSRFFLLCRRRESARSRRFSSTQSDFNVIALIGIILLIGIVKKNAIMMIDFALGSRA